MGYSTKLNQTKLRQIRLALSQGRTQQSVADEHGISQATVSRVARGVYGNFELWPVGYVERKQTLRKKKSAPAPQAPIGETEEEHIQSAKQNAETRLANVVHSVTSLRPSTDPTEQELLASLITDNIQALLVAPSGKGKSFLMEETSSIAMEDWNLVQQIYPSNPYVEYVLQKEKEGPLSKENELLKLLLRILALSATSYTFENPDVLRSAMEGLLKTLQKNIPQMEENAK